MWAALALVLSPGPTIRWRMAPRFEKVQGAAAQGTNMQLDRIPGMALEFRKAESRQLPDGVSEAYRDFAMATSSMAQTEAIEPVMVRIPEGWFGMGCKSGRDDEKPVHRVWVDAFELAAYQVTNAEYG